MQTVMRKYLDLDKFYDLLKGKTKIIKDIIYGGEHGAILASEAIYRNGLTQIKGYSDRKLEYEKFIQKKLNSIKIMLKFCNLCLCLTFRYCEILVF